MLTISGKNIQALRESFRKIGLPEKKIEEALAEVVRILGTTSVKDQRLVANRPCFIGEDEKSTQPTSNKRTQLRIYPTSLEGVIFSLTGNDEQPEYVGLVNDTSPEGIGITSSINLSAGTHLKVTFIETGLCFIGEVRWCTPAEWESNAYYLGIQALRAE